ncbi:hypothetical protein ABEB36_002886 [Hypothenemus hampei]|uniref:Uncharacterized protein n=1 Tax=Hypothenemus hampei TaxID=57062 RepID=A0ABD1F7B6_HYPHA
MSINVTVTGNPVSIKRGKMITTTDPEIAKKEFNKRRLLRLEQVRQQSKELAENVRNKIQKEKKKQLGEIEQEGKEKLRYWQNKKLLELQNQYLDAIDEIGLGHKEADGLRNETEILENGQVLNKETARSRGQAAESLIHDKKTEELDKKNKLLQRKKLVRDIENTRSALVCSMKKRKPRKTANVCQAKIKKNQNSTDINISIPHYSDLSEASTSTDSSNRLSNIQGEQNKYENSEDFCECSESSDNRDCYNSQNNEKENENKKKLITYETEQSNIETKRYQQTLDEHKRLIEEFKQRPTDAPLDTRISDLIKRRNLLEGQLDYCDLFESPKQTDTIGETQKRKGCYHPKFTKIPITDPLELSSEECFCHKNPKPCLCKQEDVGKVQEKLASTAVQTDFVQKNCKCNTSKTPNKGKSIKPQRRFEKSSSQVTSTQPEPPKDIPQKPAVKLKDTDHQTNITNDGSAKLLGTRKVKHYDHPNRFESEKLSTSEVERIDSENIEVLPKTLSETEWYETMRRRDREAEERGKRALTKERTQRDYEEMMRKLPILQRKEQISRIGSDRPEYHMSEERLKAIERERQNKLENAYAQMMPHLKPKIVTLPSRKRDVPMSNEPFEIVDDADYRTLNFAKWDSKTPTKTMFSAEEVQEIIKAFTLQPCQDRKAKLKQLLKSLKLQKEQLLHEIRLLPKDDSINALISDLNSFSDIEIENHHKKSKSKTPKKRQIEESDSSNTSSTEHKPTVSKSTSHKNKYGRPSKKIKDHRIRPGVLVLQNTSTQTTPKPVKEYVSPSKTNISKAAEVITKKDDVLPKGIQICTKTHVPCDCNKTKYGTKPEEVCKIFIKLNEDETPKVEVLKNNKENVDHGENISSTNKSLEKKQPEIKKKRSQSPKERQPVVEKQLPKEKSKLSSLKSQHAKLPKDQSTAQASNKNRNESWKEHFTSNTTTSVPSLYHLRTKPKQTNIPSGLSNTQSTITSTLEQIDDSKLLNYIKRLLSMSKASVEELGVSSSDVPTPSQSVIEMESNNPLAALHDAIRSINRQSINIAREYSELDGAMPVINTSSGSSSTTKSQLDQAEKPNQLEVSCSDSKIQTKESLLCQYADMTDSCTKRIANLAAMIDQLRQEKINMLSSSPLARVSSQVDGFPLVSPVSSEKDSSTRYLDYPPLVDKSKDSNSSASLDDEEIRKRLLEIDLSLAEKLKMFRQIKGDTNYQSDVNDNETPVDVVNNNENMEEQFLQRLQRLTQDNTEDPQDEAPSSSLTPFIPLLLDIPKLPILEPAPEGREEKRHPPPSKGLINVKKFNGNVSLIPHELSTIVEADSQISAKISPNTSKTDAPKPIEQIVVTTKSPIMPSVPITSIEQGANVPPSSPKSSHSKDKKESSKSTQSLTCSDDTCANILLSSSSSKLSSSSSSGDLKSIESMLKSIGMEWAIPTLHKTQEALALTSSSSSAEANSSKKRSTRRSVSTSELSLREFLKKQTISRISSSSLNKSGASPASFMKECSEISVIQGNSSMDKTKQRTSTPVLSSKSTNKSKDGGQLFTGASDISSVKNSSGEELGKTSQEKYTFHSLDGDDESSLTKSSIE